MVVNNSIVFRHYYMFIPIFLINISSIAMKSYKNTNCISKQPKISKKKIFLSAVYLINSFCQSNVMNNNTGILNFSTKLPDSSFYPLNFSNIEEESGYDPWQENFQNTHSITDKSEEFSSHQKKNDVQDIHRQLKTDFSKTNLFSKIRKKPKPPIFNTTILQNNNNTFVNATINTNSSMNINQTNGTNNIVSPNATIFNNITIIINGNSWNNFTKNNTNPNNTNQWNNSSNNPCSDIIPRNEYFDLYNILINDPQMKAILSSINKNSTMNKRRFLSPLKPSNDYRILYIANGTNQSNSSNFTNSTSNMSSNSNNSANIMFVINAKDFHNPLTGINCTSILDVINKQLNHYGNISDLLGIIRSFKDKSPNSSNQNPQNNIQLNSSVVINQSNKSSPSIGISQSTNSNNIDITQSSGSNVSISNSNATNYQTIYNITINNINNNTTINNINNTNIMNSFDQNNSSYAYGINSQQDINTQKNSFIPLFSNGEFQSLFSQFLYNKPILPLTTGLEESLNHKRKVYYYKQFVCSNVTGVDDFLQSTNTIRYLDPRGKNCVLLNDDNCGINVLVANAFDFDLGSICSLVFSQFNCNPYKCRPFNDFKTFSSRNMYNPCLNIVPVDQWIRSNNYTFTLQNDTTILCDTPRIKGICDGLNFDIYNRNINGIPCFNSTRYNQVFIKDYCEIIDKNGNSCM